ncbi:Tetratricopeptide repeat-like superfamily protein isoform 1 [Tripterygium wilfordii]|uniref:Tetratricopeptide repeat-like superfamily protein isoform 1 n=1 Tax=Tripterygium wilfordii TaxID=458696 RepID=A0A7J7C1T3_TRIWF|nr:pentatricopeptide repeat-containing protein At3g24000, mitochondrial [Tripterygium wilfordii]KAF5728110.1 Tetratricopeptide repeat-like superfamily protein isoform 1 [Tripterygium wilfordii]
MRVASAHLARTYLNGSSEKTELVRCCWRKLSAFKHSHPPPIFSRQCHFKQQEEPLNWTTPCLEEPTNRGFLFFSNHPNPEVSCFHEKGFSQISCETIGRAIHGLCIKGLVHLSVFYSNTLLNMYSRFGRIGYAQCVFDEMSERNVASWNNMMSGFVRLGMYWDGVVFFCKMWELGIKPAGFTIASLITACARSGCMVNEGFQVHGFVIKCGLLCDVFVGTSLVHFYGQYGFVSDASKLFEEMPDKNVVSWTSLMVSIFDDGDPREVLNIYQRMRHEGLSCSERTFSTVISACGWVEDEIFGYQVLGHVIKSGLESNTSVGNALISMFSSLGKMEKASYVFGLIPERDTISWNAMISANVHNGLYEESMRYFQWMRRVNQEINSTTVSTLLSACGSVDHLNWGKGFHGLVVKLGMESNVLVCNTVLSMYSEAGKSEDAKLVFNGIACRDLISWNSMIACYAHNGRCLDALNLLAKMLWERKAVSFVTFTSALAACSNIEFLSKGKIVHAFVIISGLHKNVIVGNALITMYAKSGLMVEAEKVSLMMPKRDKVTWNVLIGGYAENEEPNEAVKTFKLMKEEGRFINYITISNLLGACLAPDHLLKYGMPIHAHVVVMGFESDNFVQNSIITMYAKCGDLNSSSNIFNRLDDKNSIAWNAIISANAYHGFAEEALKLLVKMRRAGVGLDQFSLSECLAATSKLAVLEEGQQLHCLAVKLGFDSDAFVENAAMDMYGKCGEINDVLRILPQPIDRSQLSWNILISAFARHGCFQEAREAFHEMLKLGRRPNHVTFVSLLSACSHGGLVEEGLAYYSMMTQEFGIPPGIKHCVCVIDLLGRSGRLAEAETFINEMPVPPSDFVWRSLLAACKIHGNLDLGRKAAERIFELDPSDDSAYVLYSNICSTSGRWEDAEIIRRRMGSNNIQKKPACSWVKLKNQVSSFGIGDKSHPQVTQIYAKLGELKKMVIDAGYVADTSYALQDTDEEQKELNLWNHSERLALAFGLLNTPEGSTVKIFKNLRVCGDCHSVYKFVSGLVNRRIVLRDPYRFHHFSGGQCSCSDYW